MALLNDSLPFSASASFSSLPAFSSIEPERPAQPSRDQDETSPDPYSSYDTFPDPRSYQSTSVNLPHQPDGSPQRSEFNTQATEQPLTSMALAAIDNLTASNTLLYEVIQQITERIRTQLIDSSRAGGLAAGGPAPPTLALPKVREDEDNQSTASATTYATAATFLSQDSNGAIRRSRRRQHVVLNLHPTRAREAGLIVGADEELDWSGFGMHVQFSEEAELPLISEKEIARTGRAVVDVVQCRRIKLARKTMLCHRRFTPEEALAEVKHLHHLKHSHIVRLVGSYFQKRSLSILTYPVADCDPDSYCRSFKCGFYLWDSYRTELLKSTGCLSSAVEYIHQSGIKHMDIKPKNILVQYRGSSLHV